MGKPNSSSRPSAAAHKSSGNATFIVGCVALAIAIACSLMLVAGHMQAVALPGCGPGSPCDQAAKSVWGKVPLTGISTAALGAAYFAGMLTWWLTSRGGTTIRLVATLGGLLSLLFVAVMFAEGWACKYCLAAHAGNFVFIICTWLAARRSAPGFDKRGAIMSIGTAAIALGVLASIESNHRKKQEALAKADAAKSIEAVKTAATQPTPAPLAQPTTPAQPAQPQPAPTTTNAQPAFEGRYRLGNELAAIRIVFLTDYQCPDCKIMEGQLKRALASGADIAVSIKHFPISTLCNPNVPQDMHPDACYGAFAAEAAGELGGTEAFWKVHHWLFERDGKFTPADIIAFGATIGLDGTKLRALMDSPTIQQRVKDDIAQGEQLGLRQTPMIFINGVELRGWMAPESLVLAVEQLAASNLPQRSARDDKPPLAEQRMLEIFAAEPRVPLPAQFDRYATGPAAAQHRIVIVGDYLEPNTKQIDAEVRQLIASGTSIRYSFAHFPVSSACNPEMTFTRYQSCDVARLVEAAGIIGGNDAFWAAHAWAFANSTAPANHNAAHLASVIGTTTGITAETLQQSIATQEPAANIIADAKAAKALGLTSLPAIYLDGKLVREWKLRDKSLLPQLLNMK